MDETSGPAGAGSPAAGLAESVWAEAGSPAAGESEGGSVVSAAGATGPDIVGPVETRPVADGPVAAGSVASSPTAAGPVAGGRLAGGAASAGAGGVDRAPRRLRVDAQRNVDILLEAAKTVFGTSGVDAPAKEITDLAGVGVGTLYRHFPQRSDLVKAVFRREVDACADAGPVLGAAYEPAEALARWLLRFTEFVATKRGLAAALHSGDPAFDALPAYFTGRLGPTLQTLLDTGAAAGEIRADVDAQELLIAVSRLAAPGPGTEGGNEGQRMVSLLIDGLRFGARSGV